VYLGLDSAAAVRFLASVREGRGLKPSARAAGVGKETGYRWLRESFLALRDEGLSSAEAQARLGVVSARVAVWDRERAERPIDGRHHLQVPVDVEEGFWSHYLAGVSLDDAARSVGVGRSTAYRWLKRRFMGLRAEGFSARVAGRRVRVVAARSAAWENERKQDLEKARAERGVAERRARREALRHVEQLMAPRKRTKVEQREERYWELMRQGMTNTAACKLLGVSRRTGGLIRQRHRHQTATQARTVAPSGRYLSLRERLQIADLLRLGVSMRQIAADLGRAPSTVKRELDRHRDIQGRYMPQSADHAAELGRRRPREHKLNAEPRLRKLVQRKLNRCWSPDEIAGWLPLAYPTDPSMRLCPETIYRALLVPGGKGLHKRYCSKLRTGRRIRKSRWLTRSGHGSVVRNMTMIDQRPAEVETRQQAGHWEGDLIVGVGSASAMMTLRERKTQFGIIVNLPVDHTAASVNDAVIKALAALPAHMKRTLTWDQGVEMARHQELATSAGIDIYFAERCSPWQRGANENFNGLARQYFPKGTDLSVHSDDHVDAVTAGLNARPRKNLGYLTPAAKFRADTLRPASLAEAITVPATTPDITSSMELHVA
jgi:IS30 family transposase